MKICTFLLAILFTIPAQSAVYPEYFQSTSDEMLQVMRARRAVRRAQRLQEERGIKKIQIEPQATHVVRLGKKIISRRYSPRRVRNYTEGTAVKIHDGSTFVARLVDYGYLPLKEVRLLGVDAPELLHNECFSSEAKEALERMILGNTIMLEKDDRFLRDSYRRYVHYVRMGGRDIGGWMISNGYAMSDSSVNHKRLRTYEQYEKFAREEDKGLWSYRCDYDVDNDEFIESIN